MMTQRQLGAEQAKRSRQNHAQHEEAVRVAREEAGEGRMVDTRNMTRREELVAIRMQAGCAWCVFADPEAIDADEPCCTRLGGPGKITEAGCDVRRTLTA